jgi:hypothetical protein
MVKVYQPRGAARFTQNGWEATHVSPVKIHFYPDWTFWVTVIFIGLIVAALLQV